MNKVPKESDLKSARAQQVENWLADLSMPKVYKRKRHKNDCDDKVVFILDNDFGELSTILYLVLGQPCFCEATILLSRRLYEKNHDALPGHLSPWSSEADLALALEQIRPKIVVFASGYLLPVHDLLSSNALARLCSQVKGFNATVLTADPFLGLISQWSCRGLHKLISIDIPTNADKALLTKKLLIDAKLHKDLSNAEKHLRSFFHLYPSYTDMQSIESADSDRRNLSFFNHQLLLPPHLLKTIDLNQPDRNVAEVPHWMFLISEADYQTQVMLQGATRFSHGVTRLLKQTVEQGRKAVFLGPVTLVDSLKPLLRDISNIHLLNYCSFRRAMSLLLTAEYNFYWNTVSHTILMLQWNNRPVLFFDRGHLVRAVPAIYKRVVAWYHQGKEPPYLDLYADLSLTALQKMITPSTYQHSERSLRYQRASSPQHLLTFLLKQTHSSNKNG